MVSVTVVTCWSLQALTEVKLVNTNVKPATSVAMQQGQQAFMCSSSCPVHVSLLAYLYSYRFIVSYQVNKNALQIILFAMFFTTENFFNESSLCDGTLVCCYWFAMARSYWFISILIIILTTRCGSLIGPLCNRSVVMLFDHKHRCFRNFDFVVSIDVIRMNSYVDGFFNLTCVTLRIIINKF